MFIHGQECMTVGDLVNHLKKFPCDLPIIYSHMSDYAPLTADDITMFRKEDKALVHRNGGVQETHPTRQWGEEEPQYVAALVFPGN